MKWKRRDVTAAGVALPLSLKGNLQRQSLPIRGSKFVGLSRGLYRPYCGNTALLIGQRFCFSSFVIGLAGKQKEEQELWEVGVCSSARCWVVLPFARAGYQCTECLWQLLWCFWGCSAESCAATLLPWSEGCSLLNKKDQSVMRTTLGQEFQNVFVGKEVVDH